MENKDFEAIDMRVNRLLRDMDKYSKREVIKEFLEDLENIEEVQDIIDLRIKWEKRCENNER